MMRRPSISSERRWLYGLAIFDSVVAVIAAGFHWWLTLASSIVALLITLWAVP